VTGAVFDTGALIALERADRSVELLISSAREAGSIISVPAGCVAQAWRMPARQARLARFLRLRLVEVIPLTDSDARSVGLLLAASSTTDVVDAHVAVSALRLGEGVVTSDPADILALGPSIDVRRV